MIDIFRFEVRVKKFLGISIAALWVYFTAGVKMTTITLPFFYHSSRMDELAGNVDLDFGDYQCGKLNRWVGWTGDWCCHYCIDHDGYYGDVLPERGKYFCRHYDFYLGCCMYWLFAIQFFPARIYLGDTGALFIGFMMSVFSLSGLKNATFITLLIPVMIMGVPITDTVFAIFRRLLNKEPITHADKRHLHHRLMQIGLTHRQTVLVIYGLALIFSFISLLYPISPLWGSVLLTVAVLMG